MIPKECKRLAEVDFPIAVVSKHAAREKSIRHGHPSTLHLWWARRPLAACRSMLLALLLPDPCDDNCPPEFIDESRILLTRIPGKTKQLAQQGGSGADGSKVLREALLNFIGEFANWDLSTNQDYLEVSRGLVRAAHGDEPPLVVDPFAGGGSIPLEALRLGCDTFASDLNPVACLILRMMLEDIPRQGSDLADALRAAGAQIMTAAKNELSSYFPLDANGAKPIAYLWARTIRCETPHCGAEIPLVRSFWLSKKPTHKRALRYRCVRRADRTPHIEFEIFQPASESEVPKGTVSRAKATCPCCNITLSPDRVRNQLAIQHGGADVIFDAEGNRIGGAVLLTVVTINGGKGRDFRLPNSSDYTGVLRATEKLKEISDASVQGGLTPIPNEPLKRVPVAFGVINVWVYGVRNWGDLFSAREKLVLRFLADSISVGNDDEERRPRAIRDILAGLISKRADYGSAYTKWHLTFEKTTCTFGRPAIGMSWDFVEPTPFGETSGSIGAALETISSAVETLVETPMLPGEASKNDACQSPLPNEACAVWFTDPPYYDNVPYSYISDYFYVWLKRSLGEAYPQAFGSQLTPKDNELVAYIPDGGTAETGKRLFENRLSVAFAEGRRVLKESGIGSVVFAHQTTEGWESLLSGMISGGWVITGSWPIVTERAGRLRSLESAALATSVHLVCRPRTAGGSGDWATILGELPQRVGDWMERLQSEGIRGADLVFACIGPALELYSKYDQVLDSNDQRIPLGGNPEANEAHERGYLAYVWEVVGRTALGQVLGTAEARARNGSAGALEEDSRLTALFLWTLQSTNGTVTDVKEAKQGEDDEMDVEGDEDEQPTTKKKKGFTLIYDVARRFAQPLGIHLEDWEGRIIETQKGVVRLLPVAERAKQLFGEEGIQMVASELERGTIDDLQMSLFPGQDRTAATVRGRKGRRASRSKDQSDRSIQTGREATTLDRVHAAMLLQGSGRANALRALLETEQARSPDFLRLANALSALYPRDSEEKRLLAAMLLAVPR